MLDNIDLFYECLKNPAKNIDVYTRQTLNKIIIPLDKNQPNELIKRNHKIVELIIKYNNFNTLNDKSHNEEILKEIDECLKYEGMNLCPFSQYLMVHDVNYDMYLNKLTKEEKEYIIKCYLEDRHQLYLNRDYSDIILQVLADNYSHKRKGTLGVEKLKKICEQLNIKRINSETEINDNIYFILPDEKDGKLFNKIIKQNHINFDFREQHQGKMPDALIKINSIFLIIEHKILKQSGGGQDKQMTEIIDFVGHGERGIYYISYMDGILFNELINPKETNKLYRDKIQIINNLKKFPYNFFVNEFGYIKLLKNILKDNI